MPRFDPFPGLRYDLASVAIADVTAPPYDVIDGTDRASLLARHPDNIVRVDLPNPDGIDGDEPYLEAAAVLDRWRDDGLLGTDAPSFYGYRMEYTAPDGTPRHTTGVVGALELSRPGEGGILPHEHTTPKAKSDRLNLLRATRLNLSSVWGLSPASGLTTLIEPVDERVTTWSDDDGVTHSAWVIADADRQAAIAAAVGAHPVVIADGHHRYETSLAYRDERREAGDPGGSEAVMTWIVELADEQLTVLPIHRLLVGVGDDVSLPDALAPWFEVRPAPPIDDGIAAHQAEAGCLVLVERDRCWDLVPRPDAFDGVRDLDSSRLDAARSGLGPHDVIYQHGVEHVMARVASGQARAGVLLRPATVAQILRIADGGERMPPKTTFFHPKPRTGVVLRSIS
ncbi:MAG: DUF1015 domain-containing protein [Acidimicrobiales bacterium]|nr:DUF1015 domain-containing protein [Acidimicrobiales bacterium]